MDGGELLWSAAKKWDGARAIGQWEKAYLAFEWPWVPSLVTQK